MIAIAIAEGHIFSILNGNQPFLDMIPGGLWPGNAPRETQGLYCIYDFLGASDEEAFNNVRVAVDVLYRIKIVGRTHDILDLEPAATAMDNLIHRSQSFYQGHRIAACVRTAPYNLTETIDDVDWRYLGGDYRLYIQES